MYTVIDDRVKEVVKYTDFKSLCKRSDRGDLFSGFQVRYLKIIEKSGYQALPWVRYITQNGGQWFPVKICLATN